jgi:hypothetical protein
MIQRGFSKLAVLAQKVRNEFIFLSLYLILLTHSPFKCGCRNSFFLFEVIMVH